MTAEKLKKLLDAEKEAYKWWINESSMQSSQERMALYKLKYAGVSHDFLIKLSKSELEIGALSKMEANELDNKIPNNSIESQLFEIFRKTRKKYYDEIN